MNPVTKRRLLRVVREADQLHQSSGGSARHWMNECFLPCMEEEGLVVVAVEDAKDAAELARLRAKVERVEAALIDLGDEDDEAAACGLVSRERIAGARYITNVVAAALGDDEVAGMPIKHVPAAEAFAADDGGDQ